MHDEVEALKSFIKEQMVNPDYDDNDDVSSAPGMPPEVKDLGPSPVRKKMQQNELAKVAKLKSTNLRIMGPKPKKNRTPRSTRIHSNSWTWGSMR